MNIGMYPINPRQLFMRKKIKWYEKVWYAITFRWGKFKYQKLGSTIENIGDK